MGTLKTVANYKDDYCFFIWIFHTAGNFSQPHMLSTVTGDHMVSSDKTVPPPQKKVSELATLPNLRHLRPGSDAKLFMSQT